MRTADRTQGIIDRLAGAENYDAIKWILQSGVTTNYTESVVDAKIKANCEFQGKAGLTAMVERLPVGKTCEWCQNVAGKYVYPDVPPDVWRRHDNCNCIIKYTARTGRVDTLQGQRVTRPNGQAGRTQRWDIIATTDPEAVKNRANFAGAVMEPKNVDPISAAAMAADRYGVQAVEVAELSEPLTGEQIVDRVAGDDLTPGSCCSAAYAYTGNVAGYDVLDFRGGVSCDYFSQKSVGAKIATLPGVKGEVVIERNEIKAARGLLDGADKSERHILRTGRHGAVVRWNESADTWEYLELQSSENRGWHTLDDEALRRRFVCKNRRKNAYVSSIASVEDLAKSDDFAELLQYINTAEDKQKKGAGGGIK